MNFADKALLALSASDTRLPLFNQVALKNIVKAAYGLEDAVLQGAAVPRFTAFTLGGLDPQDAEAPDEAPPPEMRIDALWRGSIRVSASFPKSVIDSVGHETLSLDGLDAAVAAASGGVLPTGAALEAARRTELVVRLQALAGHASAATSALIDRWLAHAGVTSVAGLMDGDGTVSLSHLQIAFSPPIGGAAFTQMDFPVAVAVLIRDPADPGVRLTGIVCAARRLQAAMRKAGFEPRQPSEAGGQGKAVTALVVPQLWFDDADWPGDDENARIAAAGAWMAREGIALVPAAV